MSIHQLGGPAFCLWLALLGLEPGPARGADGLVLLGELNCTACHTVTALQAAWLSPNQAPRLTDIGSRISAAWVQQYLASPQTTLPGTTMPDLLHGNVEQAEALQHYLLSQAPVIFNRVDPDQAAVARGEGLYHRIGCVACHDPQNTTTNTAASAPLPRLADKWSFDGLRRFLRDPLGVRPSGRMPSLNLTDGEAVDLAHYLLRATNANATRAPQAFIPDPAKAAQGRALYAKLNCSACHEAKAPAAQWPSLATVRAAHGCLADPPAAEAPNFHLEARQRADLQHALAFLNAADLAAPTRQQRVTHTLMTFRCTACHARDGLGGVTAERDAFFTSNGTDLGDEGRLPPPLDGVGDKLRPAWFSNVLGRAASARPYLNTRMPQFGLANVGHLAQLFVALDRRAQPIEASPDAPDVQRDAGRQLVGTDGLSCIACHRFNRQPAHALQVTDLATATERLNEDWFRQFLLDPNRFHPGTRMPAFWPQGASPIPSLLGGNTARQHAALWTYLADGAQTKFPEGLSRQSVELIVGGEAVVYRGKLWEAGFRALAVGYPGQVNAAFDAEEMRLALLWRGRFLNAGPHWSVQGMGSIHPLGSNVLVFPHGAALAILADDQAPWPTNAPKALGAKFRGYQLDALKRPTLLYSFRGVEVEDVLIPQEAKGKASGKTILRRVLKLTGSRPAGLHLRIAVGQLVRVPGNNAWRLDQALTLGVTRGAGFVRDAAGQQELLIPIGRQGERSDVEVEYAW